MNNTKAIQINICIYNVLKACKIKKAIIIVHTNEFIVAWQRDGKKKKQKET